MGTPLGLIPFLVVVERLRNVIRPMTLAIRLAANMTAGHLLMSLLGSSCRILDNKVYFILMAMVIVVLLVLEISVAVIQAYVFILLSSLYSVESLANLDNHE